MRLNAMIIGNPRTIGKIPINIGLKAILIVFQR